jgi:amidohydrolase
MRQDTRKSFAGSFLGGEMGDIFQAASEVFEYSQALRRDFHRHPELGFREFRTAGIVVNELSQLGLEVTSGVAQTGVVAVLEGGLPGPTILLRFDMDALPVTEDTGKAYASETPGVMHACGHDGHVAVGLTVARMLTQQKQGLHGRVKFMFQPAEEGMGGAEGMIAAGVLENPRPEHTLALHIWNEVPVGRVAIVPGPLMAGAEMFSVKLTGRGGHGALPHQTIDPVYAASQVVVALQSIVSRNVSPLKAAVVTVAQIRAGEAFNVIPQTAEIRGTIRTFEPEVRERVVERFRQVVEGVAQALGCTVDIDLVRLTPPVINDPILTGLIVARIRRELPQVEVDSTFRTMVSEDMAYVMEKVPGSYLLIGGANPAEHLDYPHHHPRFDFDEKALVWAAAVMTAAASEILS